MPETADRKPLRRTLSSGSLRCRDVMLGVHSFPYCFGVGVMDQIGQALARYDADRFLVVTDDTVLSLHGEKLLPTLREHAPVQVMAGPPGESRKSLVCLSQHLETAIAAGATRRSLVVAFGGGVPGNMAGMVASLLFRGVRLVHVPTTTVAAMDSVISLKQAINGRGGKNCLGSYLAPEAIYTDVELLQTLPERELRSGLCEAAKNCLAIRPAALAELREILSLDRSSSEALLWLLDESLEDKLSVMADDCKERRGGLVLEYGHTVGHAVEFCDHQRKGTAGLSHGDSIALGMIAAAHVSARLGQLDEDAVGLHHEIVTALGAPTQLPVHLQVDEVMQIVGLDSKRGFLAPAEDEAVMVLLTELGKPVGPAERPLVSVPMALVREVVEDLHPRAGLRGSAARLGLSAGS